LVSLGEARSAAENFLNLRVRPQHPYEVVILDSYIEERDESWLFPYNGKGYVERGEFSEMMLGNTPICVSKESGAADFDR
jgi:Immunity protein 35